MCFIVPRATRQTETEPGSQLAGGGGGGVESELVTNSATRVKRGDRIWTWLVGETVEASRRSPITMVFRARDKTAVCLRGDVLPLLWIGGALGLEWRPVAVERESPLSGRRRADGRQKKRQIKWAGVAGGCRQTLQASQTYCVLVIYTWFSERRVKRKPDPAEHIDGMEASKRADVCLLDPGRKEIKHQLVLTLITRPGTFSFCILLFFFPGWSVYFCPLFQIDSGSTSQLFNGKSLIGQVARERPDI